MFGSCFRTPAVNLFDIYLLVLNICDPCIYHQLRLAGTPTPRLVRSTPATSPTQRTTRNARRGPSTPPSKRTQNTNLTACTPPTTTTRRGPRTTAESSAMATMRSGAIGTSQAAGSESTAIVTCPAVGSCLVSASLNLECTALINEPDNCVSLQNIATMLFLAPFLLLAAD